MAGSRVDGRIAESAQGGVGWVGKSSFFRTIALGLVSPRAFANALAACPAPGSGLRGAIGRGLLIALLEYLPLALLGRVPSQGSYLTVLSTERTYPALILIAPGIIVVQWLLGAAVIYLALRLLGQHGDFDALLEIGGMVSLVITGPLLAADWLYVALVGQGYLTLGVLHLAFVAWAGVLTVVALHRLLGLSPRLGVALYLLSDAAGAWLVVLVMKAPV